MCGIAGYVSIDGSEDSRAIVHRMSKAAVHRGPDDIGFYHGDSFSISHLRLSILDLSRDGHQPMQYMGRYWISYNGEVYNYVELREELTSKGYTFRSRTDTEVIVAAYAHWGVDAFSKFNGMWGLVIYDSVSHELILSRDRFGVKPLYVSSNRGRFAFSSEIKQLLAAGVSAEGNRHTIVEALLTRIENHCERTHFEHIEEHPAGHYSIYNLRTHQFTTHRFYELNWENGSGESDHDLVSRFHDLLTDSVRLRLRSDVKVGTCLSGGLDSSSISSVAANMIADPSKFVGLHAKAIDREVDESAYAKEVADYLRLDFHVAEPSTADFRDIIDDVIWTQEEPFGGPSMVMGWSVFKKARELGCKVMLNGQGGDEVLLGYERYFSTILRSTGLFRFPGLLLKMSDRSSLSPLVLLAHFFYFQNFELRKRSLVRKSYLKADVIGDYDFSVLRQTCSSFADVESMQKSEITSIQLPHLLRYEDRNSMRHSIETRLPFLDYRLVEFACSIPRHMKVSEGWSKYVLRKAIENQLPESITWRKDKKGFEAPQRSWLGSHRERMKEEIAGSKLLVEISDRCRLLDAFNRMSFRDQWSYFNLAAWERIYSVS